MCIIETRNNKPALCIYYFRAICVNIFTYFLTFIQSIPYIGPMIAKIITWPIFVTLNVIAYFVSLVIIRAKGMALVKDAKILTTIFVIGLLIGFILGRLF